ncbi:hypothetical protein [Pseudomonas cichorii]|uniref:Lipoprotein n=1 Tax=Pseudomonas cichorii TaxID=36746 RepID=A0A3M4WDX8_PSECI|nr:hypothetical protein [Pseudomonas cichorii]RMR62310.1 hypothetical protein ALP84_200007 [Pseudomonas cichorii]
MDGNQRMIAWSAAWALIGGLVACTWLYAEISDADEPFPHDPNCAAKDEVASRPWAELHHILDVKR